MEVEDEGEETEEVKFNLLVKLDALVRNNNSDLYNGMVTCQIDSNFNAVLNTSNWETDATHRVDIPPQARPIATPVPRVKSVLEKYMQVRQNDGERSDATSNEQR